jgi:predicted RNase H-related nuclease YkuK (DUF458 family)
MKTADKWSYPIFSEWEWESYDGKNKILIDDFLKKHQQSNVSFYIGTDSQTYGHKCVMTTVLIAYKLGRGGNIIVHSQKLPSFDNLRQRLLGEAMRSLETAWYIDPKIDKNPIIIHLDVNPDLNYRSGQYKDELVGLIMAQNFLVSTKPNSWAATKVADAKV